MSLTSEALLAGPRGRRLCLEYALASARSMGDESGGVARAFVGTVMYAAHALDPGRGKSRVMAGPGTSDHLERSPEDVAALLRDLPLIVPATGHCSKR